MLNASSSYKQILSGVFLLLGVTGCATNRVVEPVEQPPLQAEVMLNGCYLGELYDETDDTCYFDCGELTDGECDIAYDNFYGGLDSFIADDFQGQNESEPDADESQQIARFEIDKHLNIKTLNNDQPENENRFREIWNVVLSIVPSDFLSQEVVEYHLITDGLDNTLAFVVLNDDKVDKWNFAIDPADYSDEDNKDFIHTIIHEFAHIAFLNQSQVDFSEYEACDNYWITEGCTNTDSYINQFYERFWIDIIHDNLSAVADEDPVSEDEIYAFYEKYESHFVNDYAATNPVEDAAEIFVHFVLGSKPLTPQTITEEKIAFLHQFPELSKFRKIIRIKLKRR